MNRIALLVELQAMDTRIDDNAAARHSIEKRLADDSRLVAARLDAETAEKHAAELRARLRALELEVAGLEDKIKQVAQRLYSGRISNPKELAGLEQDEKMLKRRKFEIEDTSLDLMGELETAEKAAKEKRASFEKQLAQSNAQAERDRATLRERDASDAELERKRDALRAQIKAETLRVYDNLRRTKKGRAVAPIKGASCSACGYAVPSGLASRAKLEEELVFCVNCGRILSPM